MNIKQIKSDIQFLKRKFTEIAGIWEFNDGNYLRYILNDLKDSLSFDNDSEEWVLNGYKPLTEYIFEETYTILNPKELIYEIQKIIENEMKLNF